MHCTPLTALLLTSGLVTANLAAQAVNVTLDALTPLSVQVSNGVATDSSVLPAGPLTSGGAIYAAITNGGWGGASATWDFGSSPRAASAYIIQDVANFAQQPTFTGQSGIHEYVVTFTSSITRPAVLYLYRDTLMAPGAPGSTAQIDLNNDGTIDIANVSTTGSAPLAVTVGPQPLFVRVIMDTTLGAQEHTFQRLAVTLIPENNLQITTPVTTCWPGVPAPPPVLAPTFQGFGVDMHVAQASNMPSFVVLSLNPQPALLTMNGAFPCILLPAPDVVLMPPTGAFHIALPAAVRPVTFFAQVVVLTTQGLRTSDGYSVTAL